MSDPAAKDDSDAKAKAAVAPVIEAIEDGSWFAAVGEPVTPGEREEAEAYLQALAFTDIAVEWISDWAEARRATEDPGWERAWWQREQALQSDLYGAAVHHYGESAVLAALTDLTESAVRLLHGPAAVAAARAGVADAGLTRVAAGAAAQACYQAALCRLVGAARNHGFEAKLRLFVAGRWPLTVVGKRFYVF